MTFDAVEIIDRKVVNLSQKEQCLARIAATINHDNGEKFSDEKSQKIPLIRELVKETGYFEEKLPLALLYSLKPIRDLKGKVIIISSHIDTHKRIKTPFYQRKGDVCLGTFDNSLTNHVAIELMKRCDLKDNIIFAFTGNEEYGFGGAREVAEYFAKYENIKPKYITLDITDNCSIHYAVNLEYHKKKKSLVKKISRIMSESEFEYGRSKLANTSDETEVYSLYAKAVSICIPVEGDYHSNDGVQVYYSSIIEYEEFLHKLLTSI